MLDIEPGDLLLTRSTGLIGALIRFGERVKYDGWFGALKFWIKKGIDDPAWGNHIAVYVGDGKVIEALAHGLTLNDVSRYQDGTYRVLKLVADDESRQRLVAFAHRELEVHDRYAWLAIFSIILQLITPVKLSLSWDGSMICSAFGARCWEHAGKVLPFLNPYTAMPSDLAYFALTQI